MSFSFQKNMTALFIFIISCLLIRFSNHSLTISFIGSLTALIICFILTFLLKYHLTIFHFFAYHLLSLALILIMPLPEIIIFALICLMLRENILLTKQKAEKGSRISLLSDLGIIKPKRQFSTVLKNSFIITIASLISGCLANLFPMLGTALAYFMLFLFAMAIGSLIVDELAIAATE